MAPPNPDVERSQSKGLLHVKPLLLAFLVIAMFGTGAKAQISGISPGGQGVPSQAIYCMDALGNASVCNFGGGGAVTQSGTWQVSLGYNGAIVGPGNLLGVTDTPLDALISGGKLGVTVSNFPTPLAIAPIPSTALETGHVFKGSAGTLYAYTVTNTGAAAGFILEIDATSVPGNGALTPKECLPISAGGFLSRNLTPAAEIFANGIVLAFTTGSCLTETTSAVGFFSAQFQ